MRLRNLLAGLTVSTTVCAGTVVAAEPERPNVIVIMADDFGQELLGSYGGETYETPHLDRLAEQGARFEVAVSGPICTPSRVQLMTGKYNHRNYEKFSFFPPAASADSFAFPMKQAGYRTALIGKWQLGRTSPDELGFDEWAIQTSSGAATLYWGSTLDVNGETLKLPDEQYAPDYYSGQIIEFIQQDDEEPFFVYYPMRLTHAPFASTPNNDAIEPNPKGPDADKYFPDMVEYTDEVIGRIMAALEEQGEAENTVIMFTADNGTPGRIRSMANGVEVRGGKGGMDDLGTNVPLLVHWPAQIEPGTVVTTPTDHTDIRATMVELAGQPASDEFDGVSLLPALLDEEGERRDWAFNVFMGRLEANRNIGLIMKRGSYFARNERYALDDRGDLFDLDADPRQKNPLPAEEDDEDRAAVRAALQAAIEETGVTEATLLELTPRDREISAEYNALKDNDKVTDDVIRALNQIAMIRNKRALTEADWEKIDAIWADAQPE